LKTPHHITFIGGSKANIVGISQVSPLQHLFINDVLILYLITLLVWFQLPILFISLGYKLCQLGKHVRVSFPSNFNNKAMSSFACVHFGIWDLIHLPYILRCYVTFIDDFLRCTWLFLMKDHEYSFDTFEYFC
ncbi:hypothetical protein CR513_13614, partial [Mucuna pruriens]